MASFRGHSDVAIAQGRDGSAGCSRLLHLSHDPVAFARDVATVISPKRAPNECPGHAGSFRFTVLFAGGIRGDCLSRELVLSGLDDRPRRALPAVYFHVRNVAIRYAGGVADRFGSSNRHVLTVYLQSGGLVDRPDAFNLRIRGPQCGADRQ